MNSYDWCQKDERVGGKNYPCELHRDHRGSCVFSMEAKPYDEELADFHNRMQRKPEMKELSDAILTTLNKHLASGAVEKLVETHTTKFLESCVKDALSDWGDVHKGLKEKIVKETLSCLNKFDLVQYNSIVSQLIMKRVESIYLKDAEKHMNKLLDNVFHKPKEKYKLSELIEMAKDEDTFQGEMSLHYTEGNSIRFVYFDGEPDKKDYECEYRLVWDKEMGTICSATCKDYIKGRRNVKPKVTDDMHGMELVFFQIISYGIPVEWDPDSASVSYERD